MIIEKTPFMTFGPGNVLGFPIKEDAVSWINTDET